MSEKYKFTNVNGLYFTTTTTVGWVDVFTRPELKMIVIDSLRYCQKEKGLVIHGWCLMTSHLHMIVSSMGDPLSGIFRDFKQFTSRRIVEELRSPMESRKGWLLPLMAEVAESLSRTRDYKVWQDGNHPILLTKSRFVRQKLDYIHLNPVVEQIVAAPEQYLFSSARDYFTEGSGFIQIERLV